MFSETISQLCLDTVDFTNDDLEVLVEAVASKNADLFRAALLFEQNTPPDEDLETVGAGIVTLAATFGVFYSQLTGDQVARLRQAFADVYTSATPEAEKAGEALFNACVDFIAAAKALNAFVDAL